MLQLVIYLVQITVLSTVIAAVYLLTHRYNWTWARRFLLIGLASLLLVSVNALFPAYSTFSVPDYRQDLVDTKVSGDYVFALPTAPEPVSDVPSDLLRSVASADGILFAGLLILPATRLLMFLFGIASLFRIGRCGTTVYDPILWQTLETVSSANTSQNPSSWPQRISFIQSEKVSGVATYGFRHPVILLPPHWRSWSQKQLVAILAHELAHIERHDFLSRLVAELVRALHFYHPVVCWLVRQFRMEQECTADIAAVSHMEIRQYEKLLIGTALARSRFVPAGLSTSFSVSSKSCLRRRIEMLRVRKLQTEKSTQTLSTLVLVTLVPLTVALCGVRVAAQSVEQRPANVQEEAKRPPKSPLNVGAELNFNFQFGNSDAEPNLPEATPQGKNFNFDLRIPATPPVASGKVAEPTNTKASLRPPFRFHLNFLNQIWNFGKTKPSGK